VAKANHLHSNSVQADWKLTSQVFWWLIWRFILVVLLTFGLGFLLMTYGLKEKWDFDLIALTWLFPISLLAISQIGLIRLTCPC